MKFVHPLLFVPGDLHYIAAKCWSRGNCASTKLFTSRQELNIAILAKRERALLECTAD